MASVMNYRCVPSRLGVLVTLRDPSKAAYPQMFER